MRFFYKVQVRGFGASFCLNKNGDHNSNGIYFKIDKNGISQRCFCTCADTINRVTGKTCKEFEGKHHPLSKNLQRFFFPKNKTTQTERFNEKMEDKKFALSANESSCTHQINIPVEIPTSFGDVNLQAEFLEFMKKKRQREEELGFEDPSKRVRP